MFTILDYSSALEYSIIRRYTNIVYYYIIIIMFGNYIIFGQAELYGLFGFKFYSDYHLNSIYIYYCCFWLVEMCST